MIWLYKLDGFASSPNSIHVYIYICIYIPSVPSCPSHRRCPSPVRPSRRVRSIVAICPSVRAIVRPVVVARPLSVHPVVSVSSSPSSSSVRPSVVRPVVVHALSVRPVVSVSLSASSAPSSVPSFSRVLCPSAPLSVRRRLSHIGRMRI